MIQKARGELTKAIEEAINRAKSYIIILSENSFKSEWMPKEVTSIFNKLSKNNISSECVKIYIINTIKDNNITFDVINHLKEQDKIFSELIPLTMNFDFEKNNLPYLLEFVRESIREHEIRKYISSIRNHFDIFSATLSQIVVDLENDLDKKIVIPNLKYDDCYISRQLQSKDGENHNEDFIFTTGNSQILIVGEGGSGKSLFLRNLIRKHSTGNKVFYYLECREAKKHLKKTEDLIDLIQELSTKQFNFDYLNKEDIKYFFNNYDIDFYILIDALDELREEEKESLLKIISTFQKQYINSNIKFIYTSRNTSDLNYISSHTDKNVFLLKLMNMNDGDIKELLIRFYKAQNYKEDDDIKNNPLLLNNLIFIYFVTKKAVKHKYEILDKSKQIMIDALEGERKSILNEDGAVFEKLGISMDKILMNYSYELSKGMDENPNILFKKYIVEIFKERKKRLPSRIKLDKYAEKIKKYFQRRRILAGRQLSHEIYSSYFTACYMYNMTYKTEERKVDRTKNIVFKEKENLEIYTNSVLCRNDNLWPTISIDLIAKIDYELYKTKEDIYKNKTSYKTIDESLTKLLDKNGISEEAYNGLARVIERKILYFYDFIKKYMRRNKN